LRDSAGGGGRRGGAAPRTAGAIEGYSLAYLAQWSTHDLKKGYCKYRNIFMMASYFLVFYLATVYDPADLNVTAVRPRLALAFSKRSA
jgi:hypothetical protein